MARDLVRGGEPVAVSEGTATRALKQWDRIAARIVRVGSKNILAGGLLPFTPQATDALLDGLRQIFGKKGARKLPTVADHELQAVAFMFTLAWLSDTLERTTGLPSLQNSDGDDLMFHDVMFPLAKGVTQKDVAARVNAIPAMARENAKFWNWLEDSPGEKENDKPAALRFDTIMDSGQRVLGNVELKGRFLRLSTNSSARADKGAMLLSQALGDRVGAPLTEIRTPEQMIADQRRHGPGDADADIPPEIARQVAHQFLDRQYRETLDQPVPMLGGRTPRQAVQSAAGRQKVVEWLKYLESQTAKHPDPADPVATYSFEWMWNELGVHDLRR